MVSKWRWVQGPLAGLQDLVLGLRGLQLLVIRERVVAQGLDALAWSRNPFFFFAKPSPLGIRPPNPDGPSINRFSEKVGHRRPVFLPKSA